MALQTGQFGVLFEVQAADGVLAPGLQAIYTTPTGPFDETDGAVFGDSESGIGSSGLDLSLSRNAREAARVTGGFTRKFDEFLNGQVESFAFAWPISGNKGTTPGSPADADFQFAAGYGIGALYRGCGFGAGSGWSGGVGWNYKMADVEKISALVFDSGVVYAFVDLLGSLELAFNVGSAGIQTANLSGKLDPLNPPKAAAFPTITYGDQDNVAAPSIAEVGNVFGSGAVPRGFSELTVTIDNGIEGTPDSTAIDGERVEATGRDVTVECTIDVDDANPLFDVGELLREVAGGASSMLFTVGAANAGAEPATSYLVALANLNLSSLQPAQPARAKATTFSAFATATVEGDEFGITFF